MNKKFEEFVSEMKERLLAYEMDESCFDDYDDNDRQMMRRLSEALYPVMSVAYSKNRDKNKSITEYIAQWLSQEVKLSADEMFAELGYKKHIISHTIEYPYEKCIIYKKELDPNIIRIFYDYRYEKTNPITEAEDKAIHKKIEELKK